ncbi:MAG: hypothetical protein V1814_03080 [Candidatus Moraniibacteriota bacterium]
MKKIFYIGIPLIIIAVLVFIYFYSKKQTPEQPATNQKTTAPVSLPTSTPSNNKTTDPITKLENSSEGKIIYNTASGNVTLNNFAKNSEIADNGIVYPVDKKNYNIGYNSTSKEFIITLLVNSNIENTRKEAEADLLTSLGISKEDACKLKVFLYVSAAITTDKSQSQNHGLFFCPGSITFPN